LNKPVFVEELKGSEAKKIICYPNFSEEEFFKRLEEIRRLKIRFLEFDGKPKVDGFNVLGKGHASVVVKAVGWDGKTYALKIRRVDSPKPNLNDEAEILRRIGGLDVGIKLYGSTPNFLLLEFVEGENLPEWVEKLEKRRKERLRRVLRRVLEMCRVMDRVGLDHGELSRASKHVLVDVEDKPHIIDFGKASFKRKPSNVTSISQFLFIRGELAGKVGRILGRVDRGKLIEALKNYKQEANEENFKKILSVLGLGNP